MVGNGSYIEPILLWYWKENQEVLINQYVHTLYGHTLGY